jgi:hypothetical protein
VRRFDYEAATGEQTGAVRWSNDEESRRNWQRFDVAPNRWLLITEEEDHEYSTLVDTGGRVTGDCIEDHTSGDTSLSQNKRQWKKRKRLWLRRGRTINTSAWVQTDKRPSTAADATIDTHSTDNYNTTVWISGGDLGATYQFTNSVEDDNTPTRKDDRTIQLTIKEK